MSFIRPPGEVLQPDGLPLCTSGVELLLPIMESILRLRSLINIIDDFNMPVIRCQENTPNDRAIGITRLQSLRNR